MCFANTKCTSTCYKHIIQRIKQPSVKHIRHTQTQAVTDAYGQANKHRDAVMATRARSRYGEHAVQTVGGAIGVSKREKKEEDGSWYKGASHFSLFSQTRDRGYRYESQVEYLCTCMPNVISNASCKLKHVFPE